MISSNNQCLNKGKHQRQKFVKETQAQIYFSSSLPLTSIFSYGRLDCMEEIEEQFTPIFTLSSLRPKFIKK